MNLTSSLHLKLKASLELQSDLRKLTRQLLANQDGQRQKISVELNLLLSQELTSIDSQLRDLKLIAKVNLRTLRVKIASMQRVLARSVASMQQFAWDMYPSVLDDMGLTAALIALRKTHATNEGSRFELSISPDLVPATGPMRGVFYFIAKQALACVARIPRAHLSLHNVPGGLAMMITSKRAASSCAENDRLLLLGISERAQMVGGKVESMSSPGNPDALRIEIPFPVISSTIGQ